MISTREQKRLLASALKYATVLGWSVFPLKARSKEPIVESGFKAATCDATQIRQWWGKHVDANIGTPTGDQFWVCDVDPRNGGNAALERLTTRYGRLPDTVQQTTGGGGTHFLWTMPDIVVPNSSSLIAPGIDVKSAGGYIAIAPSVHPSGNLYEWDGLDRLENQKILPAPQWLLDLATKPKARAPAAEDNAKWPPGERNDRLASLGGTLRRAGLSQPEIEAALLAANQGRCTPPLTTGEVKRIAESISKYAAGGNGQGSASPEKDEGRSQSGTGRSEEEWSEPQPPGGTPRPVAKLVPAMLPVSLRARALDVAHRMQVPLDYPGATLVAALGGSTNRRAVILPKAWDPSWKVPPNIWGALIGRPGWKKSPVIAEVTAPLRAIQDEWTADWKAEMAEYEKERKQHELLLSEWKQERAAAKKNRRPLPDPPPPLRTEPVHQRLLTVDATPEALHKILSENPPGVMDLRDELSGLFAQMEKPGRESERALLLECWNGTSGFTMDRLSRGNTHAKYVCVSLFGSIQPARVRHYLTDALENGAGDDGLMQRLQVTVQPDLPTDWQPVDDPPAADAERMAETIMRRLVGISAPQPLQFKFTAEAQELFNDWHARLQRHLRDGTLPDALAGHLSKYSSLMPSIALLFELADQAAVKASTEAFTLTVSLEHAKQAAAWCEYLETHAQRIYATVLSPQMRAAVELAEKLRRGEVGQSGTLTAREVYRMHWRHLDTPELTKAAVEILEDLCWLREIAQEQGKGRPPAPKYEINPKARKP